MLKKVAIVAAASAASAVALAPVAMAHESAHGIDKTGKGLLNVSGNNVNVPVQACNNDFPINGGLLAGQANVKDIVAGATGALGVLGKAKADSSISTDTDRACGQVSGAGDSVS